MAGENVVASGAIAVDVVYHEGAPAAGGGMPSSPGAGGRPTGGGGGRAYTGFLSPEDRERLKSAREQESNLKELADYNKLVKKEFLPQKQATSAITKFLPMLGGVFGIGALVSQSKIATGYLSAFGSLLGALVDIFLIPFLPILNSILKGVVALLPAYIQMNQDLSVLLKGIWDTLKLIVEWIKSFFPPSRKEAPENFYIGKIPIGPKVTGKDIMDILQNFMPFQRTNLEKDTPVSITTIVSINAPNISREQINVETRENDQKKINNFSWQRFAFVGW